MADAGKGRSYSSGNFSLDIDGYNVAFLKEFSGLSMKGDVVNNDLGTDNFQAKHIANIAWTSGKATVGIGMGKGMYDWIRMSFDKAYMPKNGSFTAADFDFKASARLDFENALITSVTVPTLDGSSKEAAYFNVEFEPEKVRWSKGGGEDIRGKFGVKQKAWLCSNFRFELGGLPCNRVAKIDTFTWKQGITPDMVGIFRENTKHPTRVLVPNIKVSISYADHQPWADWAKSWFIDGHHLERDHLNGRIVFLGPDMQKELGEISLETVGLATFDDEPHKANAETVKRFTAELYVEKMRFHIKEYDA